VSVDSATCPFSRVQLRDLVTLLLEKDVKRRLGCSRGGATDIKQHSFFSGARARRCCGVLASGLFELTAFTALCSLSLSLSLTHTLTHTHTHTLTHTHALSLSLSLSHTHTHTHTHTLTHTHALSLSLSLSHTHTHTHTHTRTHAHTHTHAHSHTHTHTPVSVAIAWFCRWHYSVPHPPRVLRGTGFDFRRLYARELQAPWVPVLKSDLDTSHFDKVCACLRPSVLACGFQWRDRPLLRLSA
jgi:hypothetical protein